MKFDIHSVEDWNTISRDQLMPFGLRNIFDKYGGMQNTISKFFPDFNPGKRKSNIPNKYQGILFKTIQELFPTKADAYMNYPHPLLKLPSSRPIEFDIFIPSLNLAFEFQGKEHYEQIGIFDSTKSKQVRDEQKKEACKEIGISLVQVPYWWDFSSKSLGSTVHKVRNDLLEDYENFTPIPQELPKSLGSVIQQL